MRGLGWTVAVTERWNPHAKVRQDLFGFIDLVALTGNGILAVQVTSAANHAARRTKILGLDAARDWCLAGGSIEVWSYRRKGRAWLLRRDPVVP